MIASKSEGENVAHFVFSDARKGLFLEMETGTSTFAAGTPEANL